eukprot:2303549-Pleurochrysis_carterae.AAC.1
MALWTCERARQHHVCIISAPEIMHTCTRVADQICVEVCNTLERECVCAPMIGQEHARKRTAPSSSLCAALPREPWKGNAFHNSRGSVGVEGCRLRLSAGWLRMERLDATRERLARRSSKQELSLASVQVSASTTREDERLNEASRKRRRPDEHRV